VAAARSGAGIILRAGASSAPSREVDGPRWVSRSSKPLHRRLSVDGWVRLPYTSATNLPRICAKNSECSRHHERHGYYQPGRSSAQLIPTLIPTRLSGLLAGRRAGVVPPVDRSAWRARRCCPSWTSGCVPGWPRPRAAEPRSSAARWRWCGLLHGH